MQHNRYYRAVFAAGSPSAEVGVGPCLRCRRHGHLPASHLPRIGSNTLAPLAHHRYRQIVPAPAARCVGSVSRCVGVHSHCGDTLPAAVFDCHCGSSFRGRNHRSGEGLQWREFGYHSARLASQRMRSVIRRATRLPQQEHSRFERFAVTGEAAGVNPQDPSGPARHSGRPARLNFRSSIHQDIFDPRSCRICPAEANLRVGVAGQDGLAPHPHHR